MQRRGRAPWRGSRRRRRGPTSRRAARRARRRRRSRRAAARRRRTAPATSSATTSEYATAARGWKPPGSGITGTPSARAASASLPPVVATIRRRAERAGGLVDRERLLGVARVARAQHGRCRASSTPAARSRGRARSAARRGRRAPRAPARRRSPSRPSRPRSARRGRRRGSRFADSTRHSASRSWSGIAEDVVELPRRVDRRDRLAAELRRVVLKT